MCNGHHVEHLYSEYELKKCYQHFFYSLFSEAKTERGIGKEHLKIVNEYVAMS